MSIRANLPCQRLDQRITFQRKVQTPQDPVTGALAEDWSDVITTWAAVDAMKANEPHFADQIQAESLMTVWVRADVIERFGVDSNMRVLWQGLALDIKSIPNQQLRGRWIAMACQSGLNNG